MLVKKKIEASHLVASTCFRDWDEESRFLFRVVERSGGAYVGLFCRGGAGGLKFSVWEQA